jgi:hypothetical protein
MPALEKLGQEVHEFEANLRYSEFEASLGSIVRPYLKKKKLSNLSRTLSCQEKNQFWF